MRSRASDSRRRRSGLFLQILGLGIAVSAIAAVAAVWGTAASTGVEVQQRQQQTLASDSQVYSTLLEYAFEHPDWSEVGPVVADLAAQTDVRIFLLDPDGAVLADSDSQPAVTPAPSEQIVGATARAVIDTSRIDDALAVGIERSGAAVESTAPPALLFLLSPDATASLVWDFSGPSQLRIALLLGGILLITATASAFVGVRMVRPLRAMADAAHRAGDGDLTARVEEGRRDEIGDLARAFNVMAIRRERLEHARIAMVSDVSHELRTPLANIGGWLEAAEDGLVEPDAAFFASLHGESLALQRLIDDLHDLSVAEAGELVLEPVQIDARVLLTQIADAVHGRAEAAGVVVNVTAPADLVIEADPARVRQVIANLVSNALRATPAGGSIALGARATADSVEITVADTGSGIAEDELPLVFERFHRPDRSRTRATGGSGLGLAIVKALVNAHGGTVRLDSAVGRGTTATVSLPDRSAA